MARSMSGLVNIDVNEITFDDNSSLNTTAGIVSAQTNSTTALNGKINSVGFNTSNGVLTLTKEDGTTLTKDLDGRYLSSLDADDIPDLNASKITEGTLGTARIPDLDADKIATGTLGTGRIPDLDADKIDTGTLGTARIPDLPYVSVGTAQAHTDETIYGVKTFNEPPECSTAPTTDNQLTNRAYVLATASSGSGDAVLNAGSEASPQTFTGVNTFDSVNLKGNVFTENGGGHISILPIRRTLLSNTFTTNNTGSKWIKIATLPATTSHTKDITKVVLTGGDWINEPMIITAWFRNREGFKYSYKIEGNSQDNNGGAFTNVYLDARSVSGGAVDIWVFIRGSGSNGYAVADWSIDTFDGVVYKNPSSQSSSPTGTLLFTSGNGGNLVSPYYYNSFPPNLITRQAHHSFHASWNTPSPTNYGFGQGQVFKPNFLWSNIGSCYSSTTGKFTAKIRGVYMFKFSAFTNTSSGTISRPTLYKNNVVRISSGNTIGQNGNQVFGIIPLDIGDLVHLASAYGGLYLYSHYQYNQFSGSLIAPY